MPHQLLPEWALREKLPSIKICSTKKLEYAGRFDVKIADLNDNLTEYQ